MKKIVYFLFLTSLPILAMEREASRRVPSRQKSFNAPSTARTDNQIERQYFFEDIVGMSEAKFRKDYGWSNRGLYLPETNGRLTALPFDINGFEQGKPLPADIIDWINEYPRRAAIFAGQFSYLTNGELIKEINKLRAKSTRNTMYKPRFILRIHNPLNPQPTDVRYLQADPRNNYATFQLASTFFGPLEGGMILFENPLGKSGNKMGMFQGAAQGEESSISAGGATINRKYLMPTKRISEGKRFGYYYLLDHLRDREGNYRFPWGVFGHYANIDINATKNYYPAFIGEDLKAFNKDILNVGIGIHEGVVVTSGYGSFDVKPSADGNQQRLNIVVDPSTGRVNPKETQIINQIFTSAYKLPKDANRNQKTFARMVLQAAYRGTLSSGYYLAQKNHVRNNAKFFLTLVGGGAFYNDIAWIQEAIEQQKNPIKQYGLDVTLLYRPDVAKEHRSLEGDRKFIHGMIAMMDSINGTEWSKNEDLQELIENYLNAAFIQKDNEAQGNYAYQINQFLDSSYDFPITE